MGNETKKKLGATLAVAKAKGKLILIGVLIAIILITLGFMWFQDTRIDKLSKENEKLVLQIEEYKNEKDKPDVSDYVDPEIILKCIDSELADISELATAEYNYTNAGQFEDAHKLFDKWDIGITTKTFTMKWDGVIKAGIDVSKITSSLNAETKVLTIQLPKAKILSHDLDYDSVEVLAEKDGLFNPVSVEDQANFEAACEKDMERRARNNGLLKKAEENAEAVLTKLLYAKPEIKKCTLQFEFK